MRRKPVRLALERAIKEVGGVSALARAIGVPRQVVHQWERVPEKWVDAVARATDIPHCELRPDLYEGE
jgi:DNA-binding transcriptional regulator YdaS (Cro superfamily)